jgi:hypothetical protein
MDKAMHALRHLIIASTLLFTCLPHIANAAKLCTDNSCCSGGAGGVSYCDSSSGRFVCKNGDYSACYCTRHAVMDLQKLAGCCMWQGGIRKIDSFGVVICNSGDVSEICSLQNPPEKTVSW